MSLGLATLRAIQDLHLYFSIWILSNCQSVLTSVSGGPAHQSDPVCNSIWLHLSSMSKTNSIHIQWIPAHCGLPGNTLADSEAKQRTTLPQSMVPIDMATA